RWPRDWSSDVCSSDLAEVRQLAAGHLADVRAEIGNLRPNIGKVTGCKLAHLSAGVLAVIARNGQQGANFVESEPKLAGTADEGRTEERRVGKARMCGM